MDIYKASFKHQMSGCSSAPVPWPYYRVSVPMTSFQPPHLCQMTVCAISEDFWESGFYKHLWKFWQRILSKPIPLRLTTFFFKLRQTLFFFPFTHPSTHLVCSCSVTQSCPTLCDPLDCSTPGFPVHHNLLETVCSVIHFTCQVWAHHWVEKMKHAFGLESLKCKCKIVWDMCNEWSYESSKNNPHYV